MILKKRYDQLMERLILTEAVRCQILRRLEEEQVTPAKKARRRWRGWCSLAACLALLVAGAVMAPRLLDMSAENPPDLMAGDGIVQAASAGELSELVGFTVEELPVLPFAAEERIYSSYWGELAEITYQGEGQEAVFRQSKGAEDNSGDYNTYPAVERLAAGGYTVTLKGNERRYTLAVWSGGEFSYSLRLSNGLTTDNWRALLGQIFA